MKLPNISGVGLAIMVTAVIFVGMLMASAAGIGGNGTPGFSTSQPWTAFSPAPCVASSPISVAVASTNRFFVICSNGTMVQYVR